MYQIRHGRERHEVTDVNSLVRKLSEIKGPASLSVIVTKPSGLQAASYIDVENGVFSLSYGERKTLKASDFLMDGAAFT